MRRLPAPPMPDWLAKMVPFERYCVDIGGHAMHVMETGTGFPVVLLHGNPSWGFLNRKIAQALSGEPFRVIMPDLVGLGFSDKPRDPAAHTLENHGRWMASFLDALDVPELVVGLQDWGGPIGLAALASRPGLRAGLVVMNTVLGPPRPGFRPTAFHRFARLPLIADMVFRLGGFPQNAMAFAQGSRMSLRGDAARAYRFPLRRVEDRAAPLALARMVPDSLDHPSIEPLRRCQAYVDALEAPSAIVWGDRDPVLGRALSWVQKQLPSAPVTRTGAGHFLQEEVPGEIASAVRDVTRRMRG